MDTPRKIEPARRSPVEMEPTLDRLLIIEEHPLLGLFADVLARRAQLVRIAASAAAARRTLRLLRPDLVLIDMAMPGAFDVLAQLQEIDPAPLVVALSAKGTCEERFRLAHFGVRTSIEQPLTADKLEAALDWARAAAVEPDSLRGLTGLATR
jgi:DNA-binding response OmpR family regulator